MSTKKPKWILDSTNQDLITEVLEKLSAGEKDITQRDINRAIRAAEELQERLPVEGEALSVEEALAQLEDSLTEGIAQANKAYQQEVEAIEEDYDEEDDDYDDEDEDDYDDEDEEEEEEEDSDYEDWTVKELRAECRERGIAIKGLKKDDMIEALEEDDEDSDDDDYDDEDDYDEEDDDDISYDELSIKALRELMRDRGLRIRKGMRKDDFIEALEADDED